MLQTIKDVFVKPLPTRYYVCVGNTYVYTGFSFKKADEHFRLEVDFDNMFKSDYVKDICLIRMVSGKEECVKIKSNKFHNNKTVH